MVRFVVSEKEETLDRILGMGMVPGSRVKLASWDKFYTVAEVTRNYVEVYYRSSVTGELATSRYYFSDYNDEQWVIDE